MPVTDEFQEIAHSGGQITFHFRTTEDGRHGYQVQYTGSRPVPMVMIGVYALEQGVPVGRIHLGGIGDAWNPPPMPGCLPVLITSDSQGKFGHLCPRCKGYWRSGPWPHVCPYCRLEAEDYQFLSEAQLRYVRHYCTTLVEGMQTIENGELKIDMDSVAEAAGKDGPKPSFYVAEQSQQRKFTCASCDEFNDILGRFGYCSACATRGDLQDFTTNTIATIRTALNSRGTPEDAVKAVVAAFDTFVGQYAKQLAALVPMSRRRLNRLTNQRFHDLAGVHGLFRDWFDIDTWDGMSEADQQFAVRMFLRRHVYEHNGGEVDQQYLDESGDTTVRLKQHIRETREDVHRLISLVQKIATNLHDGFHELVPLLEGPIKGFAEKKARMERYRAGQY
jgi:hypothetical protein